MHTLVTYLDEGVELALELANSLSPARRGRAAAPRGDDAEPGTAGRAELRTLLRSALDAEHLAEAIDIVNTLFSRAAAAPVLAVDAAGRWGLHLHSTDADETAKLTVKAAAGLAALVDDGRWAGLKQCAADRCDDYFFDQSRNRSRRYCSTACANRVNALRHRERQR